MKTAYLTDRSIEVLEDLAPRYRLLKGCVTDKAIKTDKKHKQTVESVRIKRIVRHGEKNGRLYSGGKRWLFFRPESAGMGPLPQQFYSRESGFLQQGSFMLPGKGRIKVV